MEYRDAIASAQLRPGRNPYERGSKPGLPFGFQCVTDPCLVAPVHDHGNAERALLSIGLRDIHASDRQRVPRGTRTVHLHRHLRAGLRGQRDLTVDPGRLTPGVALGHLPHAEQRVRPGRQHHLLQRPGRGPVLLPRRLEDPLPQPRYVLLVGTPVDGVPVEDVLRSVHHDGVQLAPRFAKPTGFEVQRLTCPRQHPYGSGRLAGIRPVPRDTALGVDGRLVASPVAFRLPASASWASCPAGGLRPSHDRPTGPLTARTPTGFPRFAHTRCGRGGRPLYPEASGVLTTDSACVRSPLAASSSGQALSPGNLPVVSGLCDDEASTGVHLRSPVRPSPCLVAPPDGTGALGLLLRASHPQQAGPADARRGGDQSRTLIRNYTPGITGLQPASSLAIRDLVSHQANPTELPDPPGARSPTGPSACSPRTPRSAAAARAGESMP